MGKLNRFKDLTGKSSLSELNDKDISNIIDELNRATDQINSIGANSDIATILTPTYIFTVTDAGNNYANFSFAHGLDYAPIVEGSFTISTDGSIRLLPFFHHAPTHSYFGASFSASVVIDSVDLTNINMRLDVTDIFGLSLFLANSTLSFRLYLKKKLASLS